MKRLCVKKLPPILVIQLKRFDYDFEREQAIKFNDYFEFPRELGKSDPDCVGQYLFFTNPDSCLESNPYQYCHVFSSSVERLKPVLRIRDILVRVRIRGFD